MQSKEEKYKRSKEYRQENKDKIYQRELDYYTRNKEAIALKEKKYKEEHKEDITIKTIAKRYNVSFEKASDLYKQSMTACNSCGDVWEGGRRFHVDHNHNTGLIRGILCHHCNVALGHLREDETRILALLEYNRKHNG